MRAAVAAVAAVLAVLLLGCTKPAPASATASSIYGALTEAGCLAVTDGGLAAVQAEVQLDAAPGWFQCLLDGGTIAGCGVPCTK